MAFAKRQMISASGNASPGGLTILLKWLILLSELVIVPSFSKCPAAGRITSPQATVSDRLEISCTTTNFALRNAASARLASGKLTSGLVQIIQTALSAPLSSASIICVAVRPGFSEGEG